MAGLRERFPPRRVLRLLGWNLLILFVLLAFAAGGAEVYLRLTVPFRESVLPVRVEPGVGVIRPPYAEVRYTNGRDFWQVSRANSLGFLDREPPSAERAAASCHVTFIGDSFVEGREVPLDDRVHVRLEELAAREAPGLDVTTSAFSFRGTGQINQLAFYDAFARRLSPDLVVLVAYHNDFTDNSLALSSLVRGHDPDHPPWLYAVRGADGGMAFVPPAASLDELRAHGLPSVPEKPATAGERLERTLRDQSYFADWVWTRATGRRYQDLSAWNGDRTARRRARSDAISGHPRHGDFAEGWNPVSEFLFTPAYLLDENPPPVFRDALDVTVFALRQFRERAERDGAGLIILATHDLKGEGAPWFDLLLELVARSGGIPSSASTITSSPRAARWRTRPGRATDTGTRPAISGRRRRFGSGCRRIRTSATERAPVPFRMWNGGRALP